MLLNLFAAWCLLAGSVTIHAVGLVVLLKRTPAWLARTGTRFWPMTGLLVRTAWALILLHLMEIAVWAVFYHSQDCLPDTESSFYFSGVTYTTVGYGDLVLPKEWRLLGAVEGLTGILMCGLSTGFFFTVASRILAVKITKAGAGATPDREVSGEEYWPKGQ